MSFETIVSRCLWMNLLYNFILSIDIERDLQFKSAFSFIPVRRRGRSGFSHHCALRFRFGRTRGGLSLLILNRRTTSTNLEVAALWLWLFDPARCSRSFVQSILFHHHPAHTNGLCHRNKKLLCLSWTGICAVYFLFQSSWGLRPPFLFATPIL